MQRIAVGRKSCEASIKRDPAEGSARPIPTLGRQGQRGFKVACSSVVLPGKCAMSFDVFRLLLIDVGEAIASPGLRMQKLVEFSLDCLRIPVLGSLDQERHEPGREHGKSVPTKILSVQQQPCQAVDYNDQERNRMPCKDAEVRQ